MMENFVLRLEIIVLLLDLANKLKKILEIFYSFQSKVPDLIRIYIFILSFRTKEFCKKFSQEF